MNMTDYIIEKGTLKQYAGTDAEVSIPDDVVEIGDYAFQGNTQINTVTIPKSVKRIGEGAFSGCSSLKDVKFMGNLEYLGLGAFAEDW